jgi:hypothetical protein
MPKSLRTLAYFVSALNYDRKIVYNVSPTCQSYRGFYTCNLSLRVVSWFVIYATGAGLLELSKFTTEIIYIVSKVREQTCTASLTIEFRAIIDQSLNKYFRTLNE